MTRRRTATAARKTAHTPPIDPSPDACDALVELEEDYLPHELPLPEGPDNTLAIFIPRLRPSPEPAEGLPTIWDPRYSVKAAPLNSTEKQARVVELATRERLLDICEVPFEEDATWRSIAEVHDPAYVEAVRTGRPEALATIQGFCWSRAFADSVARIWNGQLAACRQAHADRVVFHPVSGAHHAEYRLWRQFLHVQLPRRRRPCGARRRSLARRDRRFRRAPG